MGGKVTGWSIGQYRQIWSDGAVSFFVYPWRLSPRFLVNLLLDLLP